MTPGSQSSDEGSATVEYVVVLACVSMGCVAALVGLGPPLLALLWFQRAWLLLPFP